MFYTCHYFFFYHENTRIANVGSLGSNTTTIYKNGVDSIEREKIQRTARTFHELEPFIMQMVPHYISMQFILPVTFEKSTNNVEFNLLTPFVLLFSIMQNPLQH